MSARRGLRAAPPPGTRVRLTGYFLRSTGQQTGREGVSRWTVRACDCGLCANGRHVATDEAFDDEYRAIVWGDLPEVERPRWRHLEIGNLEIVGAKPKAADQCDALAPISNPLDRGTR